MSEALVPISSPPPDFTRIKALVLDSLPSPHSRRAYDRALEDFLGWYARTSPGQGFTKPRVQLFARSLEERGRAPPPRNARLPAARRRAAGAADNGLLAP